ncbi:uncharacterized protein LOC128987178 isoform X2 [Macrosteles quadrilineatus]|uniref:uncharacterized protein LOC128987178 isoform X2 n=1 Tax=Macrosteles quadrilineatus TaxID=74068 RepID=UPI0023E15CB6|nr:uncharacterized protein LOC128987178 isoform X2 [Macrosteles quadrilineatus]
MKHLLELLIFVVVVSQYSTLGRRIVEREDVNTPATLGADGVEIEKGGGFPPYNYTEPNESEDDGQVDFDLDATTTTTTVATTTTITTTITLEPEALEDIDHSPELPFMFDTGNMTRSERWLLRGTTFLSCSLFLLFIFFSIFYAISLVE